MQSFSLCAHNVYYIRKLNYLYIGKYYESKILIISINIGIRLKSLLHDIMIFLFKCVYCDIASVEYPREHTTIQWRSRLHREASRYPHCQLSGHPHSQLWTSTQLTGCQLSDQFTQNQRRLIAFSNQCLLYYQMRKQN